MRYVVLSGTAASFWQKRRSCLFFPCRRLSRVHCVRDLKMAMESRPHFLILRFGYLYFSTWPETVLIFACAFVDASPIWLSKAPWRKASVWFKYPLISGSLAICHAQSRNTARERDAAELNPDAFERSASSQTSTHSHKDRNLLDFSRPPDVLQ